MSDILNILNNFKIKSVTERFKLNTKTLEELKILKPNFGFNGLGEMVFHRTYARNGENWYDVTKRVIEGVFSIRKDHYIKNSLEWEDIKWQEYARQMTLSLFKMEWLPPGRGLWMMGTSFAYSRGSMALNNCSATDTKDDLVHSAEWSMDCLMNGVGVGFTTNWRGKAIAPNKEDFFTYQIHDSREGWITSLILLLCAYIKSPRYGKNKFPKFDYSEIRPSGTPIKGFGGTSCGFEPLEKMHIRIETYLDTFCKGYIEVNKSCKPYFHTRLIADIFNAIGACVVAGNIRRSAEICIGDVTDEVFMNLKNYKENPERAEIGWMSNNSVVLNSFKEYKDFTYIPQLAKRILDNGEPGMINMYNIQKFARYGKEYPDKASMVNPCGEIALENFELCNLSETFPPRCENKERFYEALKFACFYASTVSLLPTHRPETNAIVSRNRRIGVSISGIAQWATNAIPEGWGIMNYTRMTSFLRKAYKLVKKTNKQLALDAGVPEAIRVTTIKPSGSISLLAGVTPGVHHPISRYAIRRVRVGKNSPLVKSLIKANIPYEDDSYADNTLVFEFVVDHGNVRPCKDVSPWEQFSVVSMLQRFYSDNSVSATIYFDKIKHRTDIEKMLAMFIPTLKSVSMLPYADHGYKQAPYEPIDEKEYIARRKLYSTPDYNSLKNNTPTGEKFCTGDTCSFNT